MTHLRSRLSPIARHWARFVVAASGQSKFRFFTLDYLRFRDPEQPRHVFL